MGETPPTPVFGEKSEKCVVAKRTSLPSLVEPPIMAMPLSSSASFQLLLLAS